MYYWQQNQCCNLADRISLPIIHIKNHIDIQIQETRIDSRITDYIIESHEGPYIYQTEPSSSLAQQPIIYDLQNNYEQLLIGSVNRTTFGGRPNLLLVV